MKQLAAVVALLITANAQAYFYVGNDLISGMEQDERITQGRSEDASDATRYLGYVAAVYDSLDVAGAICPDNKKTTVGQAVAIVSKFLKENPARWSEPASILVAEALALAFPCQ